MVAPEGWGVAHLPSEFEWELAASWDPRDEAKTTPGAECRIPAFAPSVSEALHLSCSSLPFDGIHLLIRAVQNALDIVFGEDSTNADGELRLKPLRYVVDLP